MKVKGSYKAEVVTTGLGAQMEKRTWGGGGGKKKRKKKKAKAPFWDTKKNPEGRVHTNRKEKTRKNVKGKRVGQRLKTREKLKGKGINRRGAIQQLQSNNNTQGDKPR